MYKHIYLYIYRHIDICVYIHITHTYLTHTNTNTLNSLWNTLGVFTSTTLVSTKLSPLPSSECQEVIRKRRRFMKSYFMVFDVLC